MGGGRYAHRDSCGGFETEGFAVKTQKWSALLPATASQTFVNWNHSPDYQYLYYTTGGAAPESQRIRIADRRVETITTLKSLRQASGPTETRQASVAPDGSPVFTRDIGTQEIYVLPSRSRETPLTHA